MLHEQQHARACRHQQPAAQVVTHRVSKLQKKTESNTPAPMSSTLNRHVNFLSEFSLIDPQSSFRRYDTTGSGGSDATTIPNTIDAWIFQPFEPVVQATGAGDAMISMTLLAKANTFGGEARDWPMFIQTVKKHDPRRLSNGCSAFNDVVYNASSPRFG